MGNQEHPMVGCQSSESGTASNFGGALATLCEWILYGDELHTQAGGRSAN